MHVDAAYAGAAAGLPEKRPLFAGWEEADSIVWNPHKWLFLPLECTGLFFRKMDRVRRAFSVVPTYLETPEGSAGVREYMDYGIQLGRRFRALKTWIMLRTFGAKGLRERLRSHIDLALRLEADLRREPDVEILAPVPFSVVVFRFAPASLSEPERDALNQRVLEEVNREGRFFISHGVVKGRYALHAAIGSLRTEERHVAGLLESLRSARARPKSLKLRRPRTRNLLRTPGGELRRPLRDGGVEACKSPRESEMSLIEPTNRTADLSGLKIRRDSRPDRGRWVLPTVATGIVVLVGAALVWGRATGTTLRAPEVSVTRVALVTPTQASTVLTASGYIVARSKAEISPKSVGRVAWLNLEEGQKVRKGELVARLESQELEAQRKQYAASREQALAELVNARTREAARRNPPEGPRRKPAGLRRRRLAREGARSRTSPRSRRRCATSRS